MDQPVLHGYVRICARYIAHSQGGVGGMGAVMLELDQLCGESRINRYLTKVSRKYRL